VRAIRPGEHAVQLPDLDRDDVGTAADGCQLLRQAAADDDAIPFDELGPEDAVDVLGQARARVKIVCS
jgi:hypothetical protein